MRASILVALTGAVLVVGLGCGSRTLPWDVTGSGAANGGGGDAGAAGGGGGAECGPNNPCPPDYVCADGTCQPVTGGCEFGYDCNQQPQDGCESTVPCVCMPFADYLCYTGPDGTENVGICHAGLQGCSADGLSLGPCYDLTPQPETCGDLTDQDCNGVDPDIDYDNDGWSGCDGDCLDNGDGISAFVNPGAVEIPGDGYDNDCDPSTSDNMAAFDCTPPALVTPTSAIDLVKAMDLCQFTTEDPDPINKKWGVISAKLALADGTSAPQDVQVGVLADYGAVLPQKGPTMAALSSGTARAEGDPGYVHPQDGPAAGQKGNFDAGTAASAPAVMLADSGGKIPSPSQCDACVGDGCFMTYDSVNLKVRLRAPSNVAGFGLTFRFYSAEYPEYVCGATNDFFVALMTPPPPGAPWGDTALDANGNPVSVNWTTFDVCMPFGMLSDCPEGTLDLVGTGMGGWDGVVYDGAATKWLNSLVPVEPGEKFDLEFIIWDGVDHNVDSLVLIDKFRWITQ